MQSSFRSAKRDLLERELAGMQPGDIRYPFLKAHCEFLSGAESQALHDFRKHLAVASGQLNAVRPLMNDVTEAAFCIGDLDSLEKLLTNRHGCVVHLSIERAEELDNASIVLWSLETDGSSTYHFSPRVTDHPYSGVLLKHWVQELPLLTQFQRVYPGTAGRVWLNLADAGSVPGLAYCDYRKGFHLLPDPIFMQTAAYAEAKAIYQAKAIPWTSRRPIAFWRGQTTGWHTAQGVTVRSWKDLPRVQLCRLAQNDAAHGALDAGLTGLAQIEKQEDREAIQRDGLLKQYVHWSDFQQWKYQIDIDGNTNAWPGLFIKLCSGCPILKVKSPLGFRQWYYDRLIPWENFVPVEADMSDLLEKISWLKGHDDDARRIGENARRLAFSMAEAGEIDRAKSTIKEAFWPAAGRRPSNSQSPDKTAEEDAVAPSVEGGPEISVATLNGYPIKELHRVLFSKMEEYTGSVIQDRLRKLESRLSAVGSDPLFLSIGENSAPAVKLREADMCILGAQFFDNLVVPINSLIKLLDSDFADILCLSNLNIRQWEGHDSVFDERYAIFFHHYFHLRGIENEKSHWIGSDRRRRIDEVDIPLFLPAVRAQSEYLIAKFRTIVRSEIRKVAILRRISGDPVEAQLLHDIRLALHRFGAKHTSVAVVHAKGEGGLDHFLVPETDTRWGRREDWRQLSDRLLQ